MLWDQQRQIGIHQLEVVTAESRGGYWTPISDRNYKPQGNQKTVGLYNFLSVILLFV